MVSVSQKAFTLAEVLITLAIIGVVAALTIPTVVRNYQKMQLKTALKKQYSVFSQLLNKTAVEMGYDFKCYQLFDDSGDFSDEHYKGTMTSDCEAFFDIFLKNYKVVKTCENALADGCIPQYKSYYFFNSEINTKNFLDNSKAVVLADGAIFNAFSRDGKFNNVVAVDINGLKEPNRRGYDLFTFTIAYSPLKKYKLKPQLVVNIDAETGGLRWIYDIDKW